MAKSKGRVLIVAGSDSGGGAGVQGDIKTVTCLGGYASTAITALTAQNTQGVYGIHNIPGEFVRKQITVVLNDIGTDAFKTGMLHNAEVIEEVASTIAPYANNKPLVLDPVMFAKGGTPLLKADALTALQERLVPIAAIITPNIPEAEYLSGISIKNVSDMKHAARDLLKSGCRAVLIKGGHLDSGRTVTDVLVTPKTTQVFKHSRVNSLHTHGTGCALASAIATGLAQGLSLTDAIKRARSYVLKAIQNAPHLGKRHGPLGHGHTVKIFNG
jgi:hydroxymethylpyrimidine/phosphomethylpyrimidine kinase